MLRAQNAAAVTIDDEPKLFITDPSDLEYFTEGAANVLYRYIGKVDQFKPHLIRLRKNIPNFPTTLQLYTHLHKVFVPLLPNSIVDTKLVQISPDVLRTLNIRLQHQQHHDRDGLLPNIDIGTGKRKGKLDETEKWGLIVEDMTPGIYQKYDIANTALENNGRKDGGTDAFSSFSLLKESLKRSCKEKTKEEEEELENEFTASTMDARALTKAGWRDLLTVEFKPKYLVQSPDAPRDWKLCRTCAFRSMRSRSMSGRSNTSATSEGEESRHFIPPDYCPLDLISTNPNRVTRAVEAIINREDGVLVVDEAEILVTDTALGEDGISPWLDTLDTSIVDLLTSYFSDPAYVTHVLADLQAHFGGKIGVLAPPTPTLEVSAEELSRMLAGHPTTAKIGEDICTAMSLRDCTVYVRIWVKAKSSGGGGGGGIDVHIECKVGDLDMKTGEGGKGVYWRDVEKRLLRGDWYTGRGITTDGTGCREEHVEYQQSNDEHNFTDYILTQQQQQQQQQGPTEELLRNGSSESFQLSSEFLKVPKSGVDVRKSGLLSTGTTAAA
ncbi:Inositol-pentakisphosphate 2-kinase [Arthrobotrys conoides]|uniref:Inositol-pentakisphosphate 2-kinase n=1 Tax=Arthrobotrys conoides TaxID=74498 RepID=A0AAN8PPE0_9PEZI